MSVNTSPDGIRALGRPRTRTIRAESGYVPEIPGSRISVVDGRDGRGPVAVVDATSRPGAVPAVADESGWSETDVLRMLGLLGAVIDLFAVGLFVHALVADGLPSMLLLVAAGVLEFVGALMLAASQLERC